MDFLSTVIALIAIVLAGVFVIIYNTLITLRNNVRKAWANIDVLLQKRHDMIGKLVDTVKGYMQYEKTVLAKVTMLRTAWANVNDDPSHQSKMDTSNQISNTLKTLFANAENYPELKADETFLELQHALVQIENEIADRREFYNDSVNNYNVKIQVIPYNFFSGILKYAPLPFFQAPEDSKQTVKADV